MEKPNANTAQQYLTDGGYFWNAGMFVFKASLWLNALELSRPNILQATQIACASKTQDRSFVPPGMVEFAAIPGESVNYAVMERCPGSPFVINMVPLN